MPAPQEIFGYFFIWKSLSAALPLGMAVSFHKGEEFVNIMGNKSLRLGDRGITISTQNIECDGSHDREICRGVTRKYG